MKIQVESLQTRIKIRAELIIIIHPISFGDKLLFQQESLTKMINSQQPQGPLQGKQNFEHLIISTPLQQKHYTNITFSTAQQNLMKQLQQLVQSSFYTHFDIYFGAQNLSNRSYIQEKYKRQQEILKLQIEETKKKIFELSRTNDEQEFDLVMKHYLKNMKIINERKEDVDHVDFIPVIYVDAKKKRPFYGHLMQEFNRKGAGVLKVKVGYRSPFVKLDCLQLNLQTPLANLRRKYFNLDLMWKNSHQRHGNVFARLSQGNESIYKDIDQKSYSFNLGVDKQQQNLRIQWQNKLRRPSIHQRFDQFIRKDYHLPSFKSSFKLTKVWQDTIQFNDINMGSYLETKTELTVPFLSQAQFGKVQLNFRKFYDTFVLKKYFDSQLMKKVLYGSSFETNFRWNIMKPFIKKYVSDISENMELRGFDQPRNPVQSFSNLKVSGKFNFHNYPVIDQAKITPFLYGQAGVSMLDMTNQKSLTPINPVQWYAAGSMGMGVAFYVNKFAQIELVYKLMGYQNLPKLEPTGFQIRIGVFD